MVGLPHVPGNIGREQQCSFLVVESSEEHRVLPQPEPLSRDWKDGREETVAAA